MTSSHHHGAGLRAVIEAALQQLDGVLAGTTETSHALPWTPTTVVGGADFDLAPRPDFLGERWTSRYRPGDARGIYLAGCSGLILMEHGLGLGLAKASTCAPHRLASRLGEVRRDRTGAYHHDGKRYVRSERSWMDWFARRIRSHVGPSPGSPVAVEDFLLTFALPDTLDWEDFDRAFDGRVREAALDRWAMSEEGLARCAAVGLAPRRLQRFTPYGGAGDVRLSPAQEICLFDPVTGPDRLIRIVEDVLIAHVLDGPA